MNSAAIAENKKKLITFFTVFLEATENIFFLTLLCSGFASTENLLGLRKTQGVAEKSVALSFIFL